MDSLDLGEEKILALNQPDSARISLGILPRSVNHRLNAAFILQHPAACFHHLTAVVRWWKQELGGAGGRGNISVSGESHPNPVTRLHVTAAFVVPYLQTET